MTQVVLCNFASPKVGNRVFAKDTARLLNDKILRVNNVHDVVTKVPTGFLQVLTTGGYAHTGEPLNLNSTELVTEGVMKPPR